MTVVVVGIPPLVKPLGRDIDIEKIPSLQWAINNGTVIEPNRVRVTPPSTHSRARL